MKLPDVIANIGINITDAAGQTFRSSAVDGVTTTDGDAIRHAVPVVTSLEAIIEQRYDCESGIWARRDRLANTGPAAVEFSNPAVIFQLTGKQLRVSAMKSDWCREAQLMPVSFINGKAWMGSHGRTCSGYEPCFIVGGTSAGSLIFNLLPHGDWRVRFELTAEGDTLEIAIDRFGECRPVALAAGKSWEVELECLVQVAGGKLPERLGWQVQSYAARHLSARGAGTLPVVYNTWFDRFEKLSLAGMETQSATAADIGCEVFVIDAGWFGSRPGEWTMVGDWRENPHVFDERTLAEFANGVRAKGMEFGLWIEPERVHAGAPIAAAHPEWFIAATGDYRYPDLLQPEAAEWVYAEMGRLVQAYGVKWLKVDCNHDFSSDPHGDGHVPRMKQWYALVDRLAAAFPDLVIEGCASGGLRNDLATAGHFATHFLSDTTDPIDLVRIGMSATYRLAPRMSSKWAVIYPTGGGFTPYGHAPFDTGDMVLCPRIPTAEKISSYSIDFAFHAAMPGILGVSGNIAGLNDRLKRRAAEHIAFYKTRRDFIQNSFAVPLTPIRPLDDRKGVAAIQLFGKDFRENLLFVYNIDSPQDTVRVCAYGLDPAANYEVGSWDGAFAPGLRSGARLLEEGVKVPCKRGLSQVVAVEKRNDS